MSNLTSTLTLQLKDDGLQAKARADAEALKKLGATSADLKKLGAANPEIRKLATTLDGLAAKGAKLDAFKASAKNIKDLGSTMRQARAEARSTGAALVRAQTGTDAKVSRSAERAHRGALKRSEQAAEAWETQARAHRTLRNELLGSGVGAGARGANGGRGLAIGSAMREVEAATARANDQLRQQVRLVTASGKAEASSHVEAKRRFDTERQQAGVRRRATASSDMVAGMGGSGRAALGHIESGRRLTEGMSRPGRAVAQGQTEEQAIQAQAGKDARKQIGAAGLLYAGHKAAEMKREVLEVYKEVDDLSRYQGAVADLSEGERAGRMKQAMHLGGTTRFNDIQVLHAQLDLAQRGVKKQFVEPFVGEVVNYAQAMNADLGSAAKTMEGIIFSTNQNVEDPATAVKVMRRQVDLAVKMSKIGGLDNDDVAQAFKFGGASGSGAGLSNETMATTFALLRRSGYTGSEAGVAQRAIAGKLVSPTQKGFGALDAMGVKWENFTTLKRGANGDLADNAMQRSFGKKLSSGQKDKFKSLFSDDETFGDQGKFITAATDIVSGDFGKVAKGKNKGKLSAQDSAKIAKTFSNLRKMLIESVDSEGLWDAILQANPTLAQSNAWATDKHGGKVQALARKYKEFKEYQEQLRHTPEGFAQGIGDQRNAGYAGAATRLEGSKKNLDSAIGQSLDNGGMGKGGFLTSITSAAATAVQSLAELPTPLLAIGSAAAYLGGKAGTLAGGAILTGTAAGVMNGATSAVLAGNGAAVVAAATAAAAVAAPVVATAAIGAVLIAADKNKGIVHGGKDINTRLDYSDELPGLSSEGVRLASRSPSLPPGGAQPASRAAEGVKSLIDAPATPKVDTGKVDELSTKLGEAASKAATLAGTSATPQIGTGPVDGLIAKLLQVIGLLGQVDNGVAQANAGIAKVNAGAASLKGRPTGSFSDGVTPGAGAE